MRPKIERMKKLGTELAQSLFPERKYEVIDELLAGGKDQWQAWFFRHQDACLEYLAANSSIRKKPHWVNSTQTHLKLTLGALVLHRAAIVFQALWEHHETDNPRQPMFRPRAAEYRDIHRKTAVHGLDALFHLKSFSIYPLDIINELTAIAEGAYYQEHPDFPYEHYTDILMSKQGWSV